jgi:hypothetical protein
VLWAARYGTLVEHWIEMPRANRVPIIVCLCCCLLGSGLAAGANQAAPVPLAERARGAERVVVGRVGSVAPVWQVNEFGDRLIVSVVRVAVNETLKGQALPTLDVEMEGGTIGELTLHVSDQTSLAPGERAVFYLKQTTRGTFVPHLRGQGVLKLDASDRVSGTSLTLEEIRREVAAGNAR